MQNPTTKWGEDNCRNQNLDLKSLTPCLLYDKRMSIEVGFKILKLLDFKGKIIKISRKRNINLGMPVIHENDVQQN